MQTFSNASKAGATERHLLLAYVADLELEVDRLRKHSHFVGQQVWEALKRIQHLCTTGPRAGEAPPPLAEVAEITAGLAAVLRDAQELPGYHPAHDQVTAIAVRPLVEKVFRWQQRLLGAPQV